MDMLRTASRREDITGCRAGNLGVGNDTGRAGLGGRAHGADGSSRGHIGGQSQSSYVEQRREHLGRVEGVSGVYRLASGSADDQTFVLKQPSRSRQTTADPPGHIRQLAASTTGANCTV